MTDVSTGTSVTLARTFSAVDGLSGDGTKVLGEVNGDVIAANLDGTTQTIAAGAQNAAWNG